MYIYIYIYIYGWRSTQHLAINLRRGTGFLGLTGVELVDILLYLHKAAAYGSVVWPGPRDNYPWQV